MNNLKWRDAKTVLPSILDSTQRKTKPCLAVLNKDGQISFTVDHCLIFKELRIYWANTDSKYVTHWVYIDEIPLPRDLLSRKD